MNKLAYLYQKSFNYYLHRNVTWMENCLGSATGPYKKQNRVPLIATHSPTTQILTQAGYTAHSRLKGQNTSRADQTFLFRHNQHLQTGVTAHLYCRDTETDACRLYHEGKKEKEDIMQMVRKTISNTKTNIPLYFLENIKTSTIQVHKARKPFYCNDNDYRLCIYWLI